jgi:catechol 2,3-dioxygenase-like lactoylglutathione lyase family enzyme
MAIFLHLAFRVKNPARSAALYADLLDGRVVDIGGPLDSLGAKGVAFGRNGEDELLDLLELWPWDKQWTPGGVVDVDPPSPALGHFAIRSDASHEKLAAMVRKHSVPLSMEERGLPYLVPVIYDHDGNFVEIFPLQPGQR